MSAADDAYASACRMAEVAGLTPPDRASFDHIADREPDPAVDRPVADAPPAPSWDMSAFDALPAELRAAVQAGTARQIGAAALELEAAAVLADPTDAGLYLRDPERFVNEHGRIDVTAIRAALDALVRERPHLSLHDSTRRVAPGDGVGTGLGPAGPGTAGDVEATLRRMEQASEVKFG